MWETVGGETIIVWIYTNSVPFFKNLSKGGRSMAFISSYTYSLDAKKRILIPNKYREELGDNFYLTRSLDDCLTIYPEKVWEEFIERINNLPDTDSSIAREYFMAFAVKCTPDSSGRILLEDKHMKHAKIGKNAVFVGASKTINIWAEELWIEREENRDRDAIRRLFSLNKM